jgi:muconate cycloisomerase
MKITAVQTTPLLVAQKQPYHWAKGVIHGTEIILIQVETDTGVTGFGESVGSPSASAVQALLREAASLLLGADPFKSAALMRDVYQTLFAAQGTGSAPRFSAQVLAGLEMALWDAAGKSVGRAVHELLGGAVHEEIQYFGFAQGDTPEQLAEHARTLVESGCEVIYAKIGRGDALDIAIAKHLRAAIGERRLRLDANEAWDPLTASRMLKKLAAYDLEFVEQPVSSESVSALAQVKASSPIAISADQVAFSPHDVYEVCRQGAAEVIVLGLHETGGFTRFRKAAAIAEAAGIRLCLHGLHETGITTCAANQVAATIPNLDDGNQYMNHLLQEDIIKAPDLALVNGRLPVLAGPGLGFEIDWEAVSRAAEAHKTHIR